MNAKLQSLWYAISRIGLRADEGVVDYRHVILVNRLLLALFLVMMVYIPVEFFINGPQMLPVVALMIMGIMATLVFNYFRLFRVACYYLYAVGLTSIVALGIAVGPEARNYVTLIALLVFGMVIFQNSTERIVIFLITVLAYLFEAYMFTKIEPIIEVPLKNMLVFSHIAMVLTMVLTFLVGHYFIHISHLYQSIIHHQKEQLGTKNKEITDSITYAKSIQEALLPHETWISDVFPDNFILYKPKDIVAGDFYWVVKMEGRIIFAVADCTGHGVPGALVSVVCHNALNRAVREFKCTQAASILDKTRELVIETFENQQHLQAGLPEAEVQALTTETIKDGMDISLCSYNQSTGRLSWAGANNPLWIIGTNAFGNGLSESGSGDPDVIKLSEFKPDKQAIGKCIDPVPFTNRELKLNSGDALYVFTDGFADQFGGPKGKKFKYKAMKELLLSLNHLPMPEQLQRLDSAFEVWRGDLEQIDDVCIMGLRVP